MIHHAGRFAAHEGGELAAGLVNDAVNFLAINFGGRVQHVIYNKVFTARMIDTKTQSPIIWRAQMGM